MYVHSVYCTYPASSVSVSCNGSLETIITSTFCKHTTCKYLFPLNWEKQRPKCKYLHKQLHVQYIHVHAYNVHTCTFTCPCLTPCTVHVHLLSTCVQCLSVGNRPCWVWPPSPCDGQTASQDKYLQKPGLGLPKIITYQQRMLLTASGPTQLAATYGMCYYETVVGLETHIMNMLKGTLPIPHSTRTLIASIQTQHSGDP